MPIPATTHLVISSVRMPTMTATPPRMLNMSLIARSSALGPWLLALGGRPRTAAMNTNRPAPTRAPASTRASGAPMSSPPASPTRVVAERGQLVQAGGGRVRQGPAVPARGEHLAGEHPAVHPGHLADAADEPAQPAAPGVLVPLLLEHHEVDRARDQHVGGVDREAFG